MNIASDAPPAVFVSYSWTTLAPKGWVLDLATELRQTWGLDVRLDKWAVRTGGDPIVFMESIG